MIGARSRWAAWSAVVVTCAFLVATAAAESEPPPSFPTRGGFPLSTQDTTTTYPLTLVLNQTDANGFTFWLYQLMSAPVGFTGSISVDATKGGHYNTWAVSLGNVEPTQNFGVNEVGTGAALLPFTRSDSVGTTPGDTALDFMRVGQENLASVSPQANVSWMNYPACAGQQGSSAITATGGTTNMAWSVTRQPGQSASAATDHLLVDVVPNAGTGYGSGAVVIDVASAAAVITACSSVRPMTWDHPITSGRVNAALLVVIGDTDAPGKSVYSVTYSVTKRSSPPAGPPPTPKDPCVLNPLSFGCFVNRTPPAVQQVCSLWFIVFAAIIVAVAAWVRRWAHSGPSPGAPQQKKGTP